MSEQMNLLMIVLALDTIHHIRGEEWYYVTSVQNGPHAVVTLNNSVTVTCPHRVCNDIIGQRISAQDDINKVCLLDCLRPYSAGLTVYFIILGTIIAVSIFYMIIKRRNKAKAKTYNLTGIMINSDQETCSICMEVLKNGVAELPCNHYFHNDCIIPWLDRNNTCPLCRSVPAKSDYNSI